MAARITRTLSRLMSDNSISILMKPRFTIKFLLVFIAVVSMWLAAHVAIKRNVDTLSSQFADPETNCLVLKQCRLLHIDNVQVSDCSRLLDRILLRKRITFVFDATFGDNESNFGNQYISHNCKCNSEFLVGLVSNEQVSLRKELYSSYM